MWLCIPCSTNITKHFTEIKLMKYECTVNIQTPFPKFSNLHILVPDVRGNILKKHINWKFWVNVLIFSTFNFTIFYIKSRYFKMQNKNLFVLLHMVFKWHSLCCRRSQFGCLKYIVNLIWHCSFEHKFSHVIICCIPKP